MKKVMCFIMVISICLSSNGFEVMSSEQEPSSWAVDEIQELLASNQFNSQRFTNYKESIYIAKANGIIGGVGNNKVAPKGIATVEQSILLIHRVLKNNEGEIFTYMESKNSITYSKSESDSEIIDIPYSGKFSISGINESVELVSLRYEDSLYPIDYKVDNSRVEIELLETLMLDSRYDIRIYTQNNQYNYIGMTPENINLENAEIKNSAVMNTDGTWSWYDSYIVEVPANPSKGFNYPYFILVPENKSNEKYSQYLVAEMNNSGWGGSISSTKSSVLNTFREGSNIGSGVATGLQAPYVLTTFPRPANNIYTHALDSDSLHISYADIIDLNLGDFTRIDKQFHAILEDAKFQLAAIDRPVNSKVALTGFSASAVFAKRYINIYPEDVEAIAIGGVSGDSALYPFATKDGYDFNYPLGIKDYQDLFGKTFDVEKVKNIDQYMFIGGDDTNDALPNSDAFTEEEKISIRNVLGDDLTGYRWNKMIDLFDDYGYVNVQYEIYANMGHFASNITSMDCATFLKANLDNDEFTEIQASIYGN